MRLKLACSDFTFPLLPHVRSLDLIATLDFERIFQVMEETGYRGWIELEYCWAPEFSSHCDNLSETIRFRDYFRSLAR